MSAVLTEPVTRFEVVPEGGTLPEAVVYLWFGPVRVLADLCTPIHDDAKGGGRG